MADKNIGQFRELQTESGIHNIDDDFIQGQVYHTTSTPKRCKHTDQRQNGNCTQQLRSENHEPDFQHSMESITEGQGSFDGQRQQFDQQQLFKTFPVKPPKEKKSISTKTFAHGLMDVSLLTTHATQLRTVMSNKNHEFYDALMWMICISIGLQVLSGIFLLTSDFFKTQDKMKDRQNQKKRKVLSFLSLVIVAVNTPLKILISAFYISNEQPYQRQNLPSFSPSSFSFHNHTEL